MVRKPNPFSNRALKNLIKRLTSRLDDGVALIGDEPQQLLEEAARAMLEAERRLAETYGVPAARELARGAASDFRKATRVELRRMGFSPKSERYVKRPTKQVTKKTPSISKRRVLEKRLFEQTGRRQTLKQAAERRKTGEIKYQSAATEEQARKQSFTSERKRLRKRVDAVTTVSDPRGRAYHLRRKARQEYLALRERKLAGEYLPDGTWHELMDIAAAVDDPAIKRLRQSPDVTGREEAA